MIHESFPELDHGKIDRNPQYLGIFGCKIPGFPIDLSPRKTIQPLEYRKPQCFMGKAMVSYHFSIIFLPKNHWILDSLQIELADGRGWYPWNRGDLRQRHAGAMFTWWWGNHGETMGRSPPKPMVCHGLSRVFSYSKHDLRRHPPLLHTHRCETEENSLRHPKRSKNAKLYKKKYHEHIWTVFCWLVTPIFFHIHPYLEISPRIQLTCTLASEPFKPPSRISFCLINFAFLVGALCLKRASKPPNIWHFDN